MTNSPVVSIAFFNTWNVKVFLVQRFLKAIKRTKAHKIIANFFGTFRFSRSSLIFVIVLTQQLELIGNYSICCFSFVIKCTVIYVYVSKSSRETNDKNRCGRFFFSISWPWTRFFARPIFFSSVGVRYSA